MADLRNRTVFRRLGVLVISAVLAAGTAGRAAAQVGSERYSSIVLDAASGAVISSASPDAYRFPASLTKMMTLYMLFEALRDRRVSLYQAVPVSSYAASMSPTKLGLQPGSYITVEQALLGLVTKSANDAATALGELLGGDEDRFAQMMTLRARSLGMRRTTFRNASGLPDWEQVTTARDMAVLARHLVYDFPSHYHYFSTPSFVWQGRTITNHSRMLQTYEGADGIKTGYTTASGFNLTTSAVRGSTRLIGVVLGASSSGERDLHMAALLDHGFDRAGEAPVYVRLETPRMPAFIAAAVAAPVALARTVRPLAARAAEVMRRPVPGVLHPRALAARIPSPPAQVRRVAVKVVDKPGSRTDRVAAAGPVRRSGAEPPRSQAVRVTNAPKPAPTVAAPRPQTLRTNVVRPSPTGRLRG